MAKLKLMEGWKITKKGGKLLVDISIPPWSRSNHRFFQTEKIVYTPTSEIIMEGYRPCDGLKTELAYYGMPVFVRFNGWKKCDYINGFTDKYGRPCEESAPGAMP